MRSVMALAAVAAVWASPAMATDWYLVATTANKSSAALVDRDSIAKTDDTVRRATTFQVFATDTASGIAGMQALIEFDCAGLRYNFISVSAFKLSGDKVGEQTGSRTWRPVEPGAVNEAELQFVCSSGSKPEGTKSFGSALPIERGRASLLSEKPDTYGGH